ncbi:S-adenosylmethionine-dependent methyltransferase [Aspergillus ibericus CBS 121593]|uniref:Diaminohydroxyphosphoribosylamino-pyrimidine deaminase n=1 Tax=Aspergillus ibericus CBS 121593 TaxID=1448316 RepID=A0A395H692_9EURO|nr:hypothetical protein BO80DRAFT_462646 [Aspergillus ibericus CBS 121593]RAL03421.1 hypothetical protein BO80DRAFT_462646 [Aspergillus ibericus CBS 121593]
MDALTSFLANIGEEVEDAEEESFLLFSQDIPSANLGFVDSRATTIDITIHDQDYTIHQSPTLLSSSRAGGTTGAVLWKITPLISTWLSTTTTNPLWTHSILTPSSTVVELGSGISALIALSLSPKIQHYIATDQEYVQRLFRQNLDENLSAAGAAVNKGKGVKRGVGKGGKQASSAASSRKNKSASTSAHDSKGNGNVIFTSLDWELDVAGSLKESLGLVSSTPPSTSTPRDNDEAEEKDKGFDLILSCDCIYNEALVAPFVRTCADLCRLRPVYTNPDGQDGWYTGTGSGGRKPTVCVIAQQQRSPEVFEAWLQETMRVFRVWRVRDEVLGEELRLGRGYLVHVLLLK